MKKESIITMRLLCISSKCREFYTAVPFLYSRRASYENQTIYVKPKAGTTALVYYDLDIPSYDFCEEMYHKTGAFVNPGDCFEMPHSMRIGYAYGKQDLIDGLKAISEFIAFKT